MRAPQIGYPMGGGFGGWSPIVPPRSSGSRGPTKMELKGRVEDINGLDKDKFDRLFPKGETNDVNYNVLNGVGLGLAAGNMIFQGIMQSRLMDAYDDYRVDMKELNKDYIELQGKLGELGFELSQDKNDLVRDLAAIQAEVVKYKADVESKTSIANTKTAASYGWLNSKFYGKPAQETFRYV